MADRYAYQSAITGQYVTKEFAEANPDTTVRLTIEAEQPMTTVAHQGLLSEQETDSRGDLYHDADTMKKVHEALKRAGFQSEYTRINIITELQNAGILFRERGRM